MTRITTIGAILATASLAAVIALSGVTSASADTSPFNDSYANAQAESGVYWGQTVNNVGASTQSGEKLYYDESAVDHLFATVWLKWKAPATGAVSISTDNGNVTDTGVAVFTGATLAKAKRIAVNNDNLGSLHAAVTSVPVTKGVTYFIQVGSTTTADSAQTGSIFVSLQGTFAPPANDNKANAIAIGGPVWSGNRSTLGARIEPVFEPTSNPLHAGDTRKESIWWKWTAPAYSHITVSTAKTVGVVSTYIQVFSESASDGLVAAPNGFADQTGTDRAKITDLAAQAGVTYYFQVGGTNKQQGTIGFSFKATYLGPVVSTVTKSSGKLAGGTKVTLTGQRLGSVTSVEFGGVAGSFLVHVNSKKITVITPPGVVKKKVAVVVLGSISHSAITTATHYTYK